MGNSNKPFSLQPLIVFICIVIVSALISGYLTFKVQFERRKEPAVKKEKEESIQVLRVKEQEKKQVRDHYHLTTDDINLEAWSNKSTCIICHSPYPHGKNRKAVAIMNLHTEFMTCHSCHMKIDPGQTVSFSWFNPTGIKVQGKPYGVLIDSETGLFMETDDHYSKLTPLKKGNGVMKPITSVEGVDEALEYIKEQESYTSDKREEIVDRLHAGTELKEFIICSKCHSNNGIMDFKELGYEQTRINQLIKMEVGGMLTNYDTFYFPDIFQKAFQ